MRLVQLPVDHLALITTLLNGPDLLRLYQTGDMSLISSMTQGGVVSLEFRDFQVKSKSHYPNAIPSFRKLRELAIIQPRGYLCDPYKLRRQLKLLPETLETLKLDVRNLSDCMLLSPSELLCTVQHWFDDVPYIDENQLSGLHPLSSLHEWFPRLHTLLLGGKDWISNVSIPLLPPSLVCLEIIEQHGGLTSGCFQHLPRTLTSATFGGLLPLEVPSHLTLLPPHMTHLSLDFGEPFTIELLSLLPSSVTSGNVVETTRGDERVNFLPRSLRSLLVLGGGFSNPDSLAALPPSLTQLRMLRCRMLALNAAIVKMLPRSLESFTSNAPIDDSISQPEIWPTHLKSLKLYNPTSPHAADSDETARTFVKALPRTLTYLDTNYPYSATMCWWADLPRNLQTLRLFIATKSGNMADLPRSLTTLEIRNIEQLDGQTQFLLLPTTLTRLSITECGLFEPEVLQALPRSLRSLTIYKSLRDVRCLQYLPPSLISFFSDVGGDITEQLCAALPRTLELLDLSGSPISIAGIHALPQTLTTLDIPALNNLDRSSVALLPKDMKYLRTPALKLQPDSVKLLPRTISYLAVQIDVPKRYDFNELKRIIDDFPPYLCVHPLDANGYLRRAMQAVEEAKVIHHVARSSTWF